MPLPRGGWEGRKEKGWKKEEGEISGGVKETDFSSSKKVGVGMEEAGVCLWKYL